LEGLKGSDHSEEFRGLDLRIILKWNLGVEWIHVAQNTDRWRGAIKGGEFLD
jgi:hypothetical protein